MDRLLAIFAREPRSFCRCLRDAPRSLAVLRREHADGWGVAVHEPQRGWTLTKEPVSPDEDPAFDTVVADAEGSLLIGHVGRAADPLRHRDSLHPLRQGDWVFAHNDTGAPSDELRATIAAAGSEPIGKTHSEMLLGFFTDRLAARCGALGSQIITDMVLARAVGELASLSSLSPATFVLSDGHVLYAYRQARPLYFLERRVREAVDALLFASEPITTGEDWKPVEEGTLIAAWRRPTLGWGVMRESPVSLVRDGGWRRPS